MDIAAAGRSAAYVRPVRLDNRVELADELGMSPAQMRDLADSALIMGAIGFFVVALSSGWLADHFFEDESLALLLSEDKELTVRREGGEIVIRGRSFDSGS